MRILVNFSSVLDRFSFEPVKSIVLQANVKRKISLFSIFQCNKNVQKASNNKQFGRTKSEPYRSCSNRLSLCADIRPPPPNFYFSGPLFSTLIVASKRSTLVQ